MNYCSAHQIPDPECPLCQAEHIARAQLHASVAASQDIHSAQDAELATLGSACDKFRRADGELRAELDRLKEANARHAMNAINAICGTCGGSRNQDGVCPDCALAKLTAERDALLTDKARLDWADQRDAIWCLRLRLPSEKDLPSVSLRAAIDAARKEKP